MGLLRTNAFTDHGDSGGPVWNMANGMAVGLALIRRFHLDRCSAPA